ncbi:class I SAM-dependent methyltransferase [Geofilum rubicundum]|uniref:class I SAM-dependent methyltransferase n=1 Tax=Geofilum rubicundum TaxID=472113 RepID=UPI00138E5548|nr:methyltransferase domain-containing protein [Geofilum rubicundum]
MREQVQRLTSPLFYGHHFYCNCCDKSFRKFLTKGYVARVNAHCPFCASLERTRVLELYIQKELNLYESENTKIRHFAAEYGLFRKLSKNKNITYIEADLNPAYARNVIDITNIPFPGQYFDYIICSHVLRHVPDETLAEKELHRVLKSDGTALILTLLSDKDKTFEDNSIQSVESKIKSYGDHDLCRLHGKDFAQRLESNGFKVEEIDYRLQFSEAFQKKHALGNGEREKIFKCTK